MGKPNPKGATLMSLSIVVATVLIELALAWFVRVIH
jgi:hypothetical protein